MKILRILSLPLPSSILKIQRSFNLLLNFNLCSKRTDISDSDRPAVTCSSTGTLSSAPLNVQKQSQADWTRLAQRS
ncbi:hypothetical protein Pan161_45800 [Gimesia algae]|uniref:Uncharacterized protein n=1 Tax=Gimesia algae TaxID=2527971 RepID=A0A517VIT5_9PLAN|nr:hypothetical protein Pan161_45800 [Gimesia algae]